MTRLSIIVLLLFMALHAAAADDNDRVLVLDSRNTAWSWTFDGGKADAEVVIAGGSEHLAQRPAARLTETAHA